MDVGSWLRALGLGQYEAAFRDNDIDNAVLPKLTLDDLKDLGVAAVGHRRKLMSAIEALNAPSAAPASADAAERRQLTVMFCDLVGSTALSARLDPEDMRQVIHAYQDACSGVLARYEGFVAKFFGNGILATFGFPRAHEDDAARAVHAALDIAEAVGRLQTRALEKLAVRIGIATGLVVAGDIVGQGAAQEQVIVGDTPNLAARLQGLADPGGVVLSSATRRLIGDRFRLKDLGRHAIKGLAEPVEAYAALCVSESESRFDAAQSARLTGFVGREAESAELIARQRRAWAGEGQTVLISGEAGIGKSRLSAWLAEQVADTAHARLRYQCSPYHRDSALHPFALQFERAAGIAAQEPPEVKLDKLERALGLASERRNENVPLIASMLSIPLGKRYPVLTLSPAQQRRLTLSALLDQMEGLARQKPLLILFEDAHWADATSLEVLDLVIERAPRLPVLLLITFRPEFDAPWSAMPGIATVTLGRLDPVQAATLVERVTGGRKLPAEVLAQIVAKTDGVPLFVEELTKDVIESGLLVEELDRYRLDGPLPPLAIPSTLQDSLMARLDRLAAVKEIAQIGAAIGREFSYALLHQVVGRDEATLRAGLAQLEDSELVFRSGEPPAARYTFKHALVQDAAYESLLKSRRQILHGRIAATLENQFPALADAEPEILAHHLSRAGLSGSACLCCMRAGERALARSFYAEAVGHFETAIAEAGRMPEGEDRDRNELAARLKQGPAIVVFRSFRSPELERTYQRAYELASALGDEYGRFKSLWGLWFSANLTGRTAAARDRADELIALGRQSGNEDWILEAQHCRWSTAFFRGDVLGCLTSSQEGVRRYDRERHSRLATEFGGHDPGVCANALVGLSHAQFGSPREAISNMRRAVDLAKAI